MVKKRKARKTAATKTVYRTRTVKARTHHKKSDAAYIPAAAATVALVAVNADKIKTLYKAVTNSGTATIPNMLQRAIPGKNSWTTNAEKAFITSSALITDAVAIAGGMIGGELFKKYAPGVIKKPVAKIAKKIPKVF